MCLCVCIYIYMCVCVCVCVCVYVYTYIHMHITSFVAVLTSCISLLLPDAGFSWPVFILGSFPKNSEGPV